MQQQLINARLVYDGGEQIHVPPEMGTPRHDQLQGTPLEQLAELCGRICYDSLGSGRPSFSANGKEGYHEHIAQVGHLSVYEHCNVTILLYIHESTSAANLLSAILNRPGLYAVCDLNNKTLRLTFNPRDVLDWQQHSPPIERACAHDILQSTMRDAISRAMPNLKIESCSSYRHSYAFAKPFHEGEQWIGLYLSGSRGFSHEQVRHGDFTAISQRSTRYVNESESPWVEHPLIAQFNRESNSSLLASGDVVRSNACLQYTHAVSLLEPWLVSRGVDKGTARKQARGAARGYLGNALHTEMIFSASVAQWKRMLRQRATVHADAEIREVYAVALGELKRSRYGSAFESFELAPSPDGIGQIAVETNSPEPQATR